MMDGCQPGTGTYGGLCGGSGRGMRPEWRSGKRFPRRRNKFGRRHVKATPIPGVAFFFRRQLWWNSSVTSPLNPPLSKGGRGDLTGLGQETRFLEDGVRHPVADGQLKWPVCGVALTTG